MQMRRGWWDLEAWRYWDSFLGAGEYVVGDVDEYVFVDVDDLGSGGDDDDAGADMDIVENECLYCLLSS